MKKLKSSLLNMVLSLGLITIVAALLLGGVYVLTKDMIAESENREQVKAVSEVAPEFDNNPLEEQFVYKANSGTKDSIDIIVYPARKGGQLVGAAVKSISKNGFSGEIEVMYGFNLDGSINNYKVLKHAETAGLGSKMQEWFRTEKGNQNVLGLNPAKDVMKVEKDGGKVDAITAATISSRAFLDALNDAYRAYVEMQNERKEAQE